MNRTVLRPLALSLLLAISGAAAGDEKEALRDECRRVAEGHGVSTEQMDAWIGRCVENASRIRGEMKRDRPPQEAPPHQGSGGSH